MKKLAFALISLLSLAPLARAAEVLPFVDDDYATALGRARTKHLPIFVEAWAPW